jgi:hypothetical protein
MIIFNTKYPDLSPNFSKLGVSFNANLMPGVHLELECIPDTMARERGLLLERIQDENTTRIDFMEVIESMEVVE